MRAYFAFVDNPDGAYRLVFESDLMNEPAVSVRVEAANHEIAKTAEVVSEPAIGQIRLQWWREALEGVEAGRPRAHEVAIPLAEAV